MVFPSWLRPCAAVVFVAGLLGLGSGCHKSGEPAGTVQVTGYVTFQRVPMLYDGTTGQPTGLGAGSITTPARGVVVRAFQLTSDVGQDGVTRQTWHLAASTVTDLNGYYAFNGAVLSGYSTFLEVDSIYQEAAGNQSTFEVIADPNGIGSALPQPKRPIYAYRLDSFGNPIPDPTTATPPAQIAVNTIVNFALTDQEPWVATVPNWYVPGVDPNHYQAPPTETVNLGSKVLGILDSAYVFAYYYGDPTPSLVHGGAFDLHYHPGRTESPRRSFVVYDRSLTPLAYDGSQLHYFGTLAGGGSVAGVPAADDAWDQGVIFPMLARNFLFGQGKTALFPTGPDGPDSEAPDLAVVDGLGDAMAATLLTTPWLTDTSSTAATVPPLARDIRVIPAQPGIGSPATLAAAAWQLTLKANGFTTAGNYPAWQAGLINPSVMLRFFTLIQPYTVYTETHGTVAAPQDICSFYAQAGRLQEAERPGEAVNLQAIFYDQNLGPWLLPYGILWPQTPGVTLATDWDGTTSDPNLPGPLLATLPSFTLSMANAGQVPNPQIATPGLVFPNSSQGEVAFAKLAGTLDLHLRMSLAAVTAGTPSTPGLPPGSTIEVVVDGTADAKSVPAYLQPQTFLFTPGSLGPVDFTLRGNPADFYNPLWHWVRIRMISPATRQPDVQITVSLVAIP